MSKSFNKPERQVLCLGCSKRRIKNNERVNHRQPAAAGCCTDRSEKLGAYVLVPIPHCLM